jgi:DNA modification methylase
LTHGFFKYPCKFIPNIPRWAIKKYLKGDKDGLLDPFCGSGTTLVEGVLHQKKSYGIEIDSFGRLLSKVKTTQFSAKELKKIEEEFLLLSKLIYKKGKAFKPNIDNISLWFDDESLYSLGRIKFEIDKLEAKQKDKDLFNICLASIIRKVSNAENGSPKPYVAKRFPKNKENVPELFINTFKKMYKNIVLFSDCNIGYSKIIGNDARTINKDITFDLAITSPPYINAFDYVRTLRLENLWLNLNNEDELRDIKKNHIGTELANGSELFITKFSKLNKVLKAVEKKDAKRAKIILKFFLDMEKNMRSVFDVLNNKGVYCIVVGDSVIKGVDVPTHKILVDIAENIGFNLDNVFSYVIKNRYLRFPRSGKGGLIKNDWVICFKK